MDSPVKSTPVGKQAFDKKLDAIDALAESRDPAQIRKALKDRNNFLVSKAAAVVARIGAEDLIPDLVNAFDRFMTDPVKTDPKCWAKIAIAKALKDLDCDDSDLFIRGLKHIQMEPAYVRPEDTAVTLRSTCAVALVGCGLPRYEILKHLVDALGSDPQKEVRMNAARAIGQVPGQDSLLILRLKALSPDDPEVIGQCFTALLEISAAEQLPFVAGFMKSGSDIAMEAAAALGECHDPQAASLLIECYEANPNPELRRAILLSMGASRHAAAADFLLSVIAKGRREQASIAIRALASGRFRDEYKDRVRAAIEDRELIAQFDKEFFKN